MTFGEQLRRERQQRRLSQADLADGLCSLSYISHLEAGRRLPAPELIDAFEKKLSLPMGTLSDAVTVSVKPAVATAVDLYVAAQEAQHNGAFARALSCAKAAGEAASVSKQQGLAWLAGLSEVEAHVGLGDYDEAAKAGERLLSLASGAEDGPLASRSRLAIATALHLDRRDSEALPYARSALGSSLESASGSTLRVRASLAVLASGGEASDEVERDLEQLLPELHEQHIAGLAYWALGNASFRRGDSKQGVERHRHAAMMISPSADFRNWARFRRASADERINAGICEGVKELLAQAGPALDSLGSVDEIVALHCTEAKFYSLTGEPERALEVAAQALQMEDVPVTTRAETLLVAAKAAQQTGQLTDCHAYALRAAREFTRVGDSAQAELAWAILEGSR